MKKAVLIIGAFSEFIEEYVNSIKNLNYNVVCIDDDNKKYKKLFEYKRKNKDHFSHKIDKLICTKENSDFLEEIFHEVDLLKRDYKIVGILGIAEKKVIHTACLAEYLNLPSINIQSAVISRNKYLQRQLLKNTSWGVDSEVISINNYFNIPSSGVIKPINDHGSSNIVIWDTSVDEILIQKQILLLDNNKSYLLEEKIEGPEFSIESWVKNGKIIFSSITKKTTMKCKGIEFPVELGHEINYNSKLPNSVVEEINKMNEFIIKESKVSNAIVHLEFKLENNIMPKVMEWCVRNPGDRIMDLYLYKNIINPYELYIKIILDKDISFNNDNNTKVYQKYFILNNNEQLNSDILKDNSIIYWPGNENYVGFKRDKKGKEYKELPGVIFYEIGILIDANNPIRLIRDSFSRHCYAVYSTDIDTIVMENKINSFVKKLILNKS